MSDVKVKENNMLPIVIMDGIAALVLVLLGYWISGIIGFVQQDNLTVVEAVLKIVEVPFSRKYFNDYTPILMALGAVCAEFFLYLYLFKGQHKDVGHRKEENADLRELTAGVSIETETEKESEMRLKAIDKNVDSRSETVVKKEDVVSDFNIVLPANKESETIITHENIIEPIEIEVQEAPIAEFSSDVVSELAQDYEMEQICAMLQITTYMSDINSEMLRNMFSPEMSAEEIREYIKIFYD